MCVHVLQRERDEFLFIESCVEIYVGELKVEKIAVLPGNCNFKKKEETKVDQLDHVNRTPEICLFFFLSFCDFGIVYSNP